MGSEQAQTRRTELLHGLRDEAPLLLGVAPFGLIFGALALRSGMTVFQAQATSSIIFAGSAQFIAAQLVGAGASAAVILMVVFVVNLRHALYSASVAPFIAHLKPAWRYLLAYLLTDEAYAVVITKYNSSGSAPNRHWYFLGAGLTLWAGWNLSTLLGVLAGTELNINLPVSFTLPLVFIALVVPALKDRAVVAAALAAGLVGLLANSLPYKTGLVLAALVGIATGMWVESRRK